MDCLLSADKIPGGPSLREEVLYIFFQAFDMTLDNRTKHCLGLHLPGGSPLTFSPCPLVSPSSL